jgi:hypothetical protein
MIGHVFMGFGALLIAGGFRLSLSPAAAPGYAAGFALSGVLWMAMGWMAS